jgi:hypothetical protein
MQRGVINSTHSGHTSRLRSGLCEAVGLLFKRPHVNERHVAVVPDVSVTRTLGRQMVDRLRNSGVEIAVIDGFGTVTYL